MLLVTLIFWTKAAEEALNASQLKAFEEKCSSDLMGIVEMVRGQLTTLQRATLGALVVTDVHARDVISNLVSEGVSSAAEFSWQARARCRSACLSMNPAAFIWDVHWLLTSLVLSTIHAGTAPRVLGGGN